MTIYSVLSIDELLEMLEHGADTELLSKGIDKYEFLIEEVKSAVQTLNNLANGELRGDASIIAKNAAFNLDKVINGE